MIEQARALRDEVRANAEGHEIEAARLWAFLSELDAFIDAPSTAAGDPASDRADEEMPVAGGLVDGPARPATASSIPAPAAVSSPPGDGSPAIHSPGSARSTREGTPARSVGTPTPASQPPARRERQSGKPVQPSPAALSDGQILCPECSEPVTPRGLGVHRSRSKAHAAAIDAKARTVAGAAPQPLGADTDRRVIDDLCPKGCGQRFTWEPRLLSHAGSCDGKRST